MPLLYTCNTKKDNEYGIKSSFWESEWNGHDMKLT